MMIELHVIVSQAEGLVPPTTLAVTKFWCVVDVYCSDGTLTKKTRAKKSLMINGAPIWEEMLVFKINSLVGSILVVTVYAPTLIQGDENCGSVKIPLTGVKVLPEWSSTTKLDAKSPKLPKKSDEESQAVWYNLEPEDTGRIRVHCEAIEIGDVVLV